MIITAMPRWSAPQPGPRQGSSQDEPDEDTFWEKVSHAAGTVFSGIAKIPAAFDVAEEFVGTELVEAALPALGVTAACGGVLGMTGLAVAGSLEVKEGWSQSDPAHALAGSGDICRGMFVGSLTGHKLIAHPQLQASVLSAGRTMLCLQGGLFVAAGLTKIGQSAHHSYAGQRQAKRVEGMLEVGMGTCALAAAAGLKPGVALATAGALGVTKFGYRHRHGLHDWAHRMVEHSQASWHKLEHVFRPSHETGAGVH